MNNSVISQNIRAERTRAGLTQKEVSDILKINRRTYMGYENGNSVNAYVLWQLQQLFNCNIENFFITQNETK